LAVENQNPVAAPEMKPLCPEGQVPVAIQDPRYFHKGNPLIGPYAAPGPEHELPREFVKRNLLLTFDYVYGRGEGGSTQPNSRSAASPPVPPCMGVVWFGACYYYASAGEQPLSVDGGGMTLEIVSPLVDSGNSGGHSIGEIAAQSPGVAGGSLDDVEMGFSVSLSQWGDNNVHLIVYHWVDGAETCYNTCDWNQYSSTYFPGMDLSPLIGQQAYIGWVQYQGAWWAWFNGQWLGYINDSAWTNNFTKSTTIQWYGEVAVVNGIPPRTQMGNGQFPEMTTAASMSNLCGVDANAWVCDYDDYQSAFATQPSYYNILNNTSFGAVRYGGPGQTVGEIPIVAVTPSATNITTVQAIMVTVAISGGTGNPTPTGTVTLTSGSYTSPATTLANGGASIPIPAGSLAVGNDTLTVNYAPDVASAWTYNYASGTATISVSSVNAIVPAINFRASPNPILVQNAVTLTATVTSSAGTPTGSVTFSDSGTTLGTANLNGGVAALAISTLAVGSHSITAAYGGDGNFSSVSSTAVSETVEDFALTIGGSGSSQTAQPGGTATYTLLMSPSGGTTFPAAVTFSTSGAPTGFTATFSPSSLAAGGSATNVALTIQVSVTATLDKSRQPGRGLPLVALGILVLPFVAGIKRRGNGLRLALIVMIVALSTLTGCGGGGNGSSSGGSSQPQTYNITVTATSGTLSHSTTVTLTVE
jgi:hypothetical protein